MVNAVPQNIMHKEGTTLACRESGSDKTGPTLCISCDSVRSTHSQFEITVNAVPNNVIHKEGTTLACRESGSDKTGPTLCISCNFLRLNQGEFDSLVKASVVSSCLPLSSSHTFYTVQAALPGFVFCRVFLQ